jgi:hypothetical protein
MRGATRPISLRLAPCHIEQLHAAALGALTRLDARGDTENEG